LVVYQNLYQGLFFSSNALAFSSQKLIDALNQIGLQGYEDEYCGKLSAGQKRRVILAGLFVSNAKVWLLDEPFTALDPQGVKIIEHCISKHGKQGGLCLFTTHLSAKCTQMT
jgi:heme exporter protein A